MLPTIGNDICHVPRIYRILVEKTGRKFVQRILTPVELQHPRARKLLQDILDDNLPKREYSEHSPRDQNVWAAAQFMAGRFAAKEAAIKAHPWRKLQFDTVEIGRYGSPSSTKGDAAVNGEVENTVNSGPTVAIIKNSDCDDDKSNDNGGCFYASVSISHDGDYATAVCLGNMSNATLHSE